MKSLRRPQIRPLLSNLLSKSAKSNSKSTFD